MSGPRPSHRSTIKSPCYRLYPDVAKVCSSFVQGPPSASPHVRFESIAPGNGRYRRGAPGRDNLGCSVLGLVARPDDQSQNVAPSRLTTASHSAESSTTIEEQDLDQSRARSNGQRKVWQL